MAASKPKPEPGPKPAFQRIEEKVYWQTSRGELVLPLRVKTGFYRRLVNVNDPIVQFAMVMEEVGAEDALAEIDELDLIEGSKIAAEYFAAMGELVEATLGELFSSST